MWRVWFKRFGKRVVCVLDGNNEVTYRFVKKSPFGDYVTRYANYFLMDDGTIKDRTWMKWKEV